MAEQRQTFRFRLPWVQLAPAVETPTPTQPTTAPVQRPLFRPPFRPPGLAPAQAPPQAQASTRTESQPPSPSRAATQSRVTSQPASPNRAGTQTRVTSQPSSPRAAPQPRAASQLSSPSRTVPQTQPASQQGPQPRSPSRLASLPAGQTSPLPPPISTEPPPSVSQRQLKPEVSQPESKEPQPKAEITSDNGTTRRPSKLSGPVLADEKSEENNGRKEVVQELIKEGKTNGITYEEQKQRSVTELLAMASGSKAPVKEQPGVAFQAAQKQQENQGILGKKETSATSDSNGKTAISYQKDKITVSESRQKPALSNGEPAPMQKEIREDIFKFVRKMTTEISKHPMDEKPVSIVTVAGENRGASMHLGSESAKREGTIHIRRGYKLNPDKSIKGTTDGEGSSKEMSEDSKTKEDQATKAYINSNIQGINNSILFKNSVTERNPGVHLAHN